MILDIQGKQALNAFAYMHVFLINEMKLLCLYAYVFICLFFVCFRASAIFKECLQFFIGHWRKPVGCHCQNKTEEYIGNNVNKIQYSYLHSNAILNMPMYSFISLGLKIKPIKIARNDVDDFDTLTTWRHMTTSSLKRKDHAFFGVVYASIFIKFNYNKFAG